MNKLEERFSNLVDTWDCYNDSPRDEDEIVKDCQSCATITKEIAIGFKNWYSVQDLPMVLNRYSTDARVLTDSELFEMYLNTLK